MAIDNFKPTIWSDLIFQSYDDNFVFSQLSNRAYEGEISAYGDQVKINEIGDVTVNAYTGTVTYEELNDASKYLLIDKKKYSAVSLDDVDNVQSKPKVLGEATRKMGVAHADDVDTAIASLYVDAGITSGSTSSPTSITSVTVTSKIRDIATSMSENSVPKDRRVAVLPPWLVAKIDLANVVRNTDNPFIMNNAYVGRFMGFDIFESQNIQHSGTTWYAPMFFRAGDTIAHAEQLTETEALRAEGSFSDKVRNLMVYGSKVVRPDSLAVGYWAEGSETTI